MRESRPHQREMVRYLTVQEHGALLVEMRLGKSHAIIKAYQNEKCVLVVCPKTVMSVWADELRYDGIPSSQITLLTSSDLKKTKTVGRWVVANYEAVPRMSEELRSRFDVIVLDEAVRIKNPQTKLSRFFVDNFRDARRCIASGNLAPESPLEYFTPMQFVYGKFMGCKNFWQFRKAFFSSDFRGWTWWPKNKQVRQRIKDAVRDSSFILTRKQAGLANEKIYERRYIELPKPVRKMYDDMENQFALELPSGESIEVSHTVAQVSYLSQLAGGGLKKEAVSAHKIDELMDLLSGELANEQVVIWFRYNFELERVLSRMVKKGWRNVQFIRGDSSMEQRELAQSEFQSGNCRLILLQIKVGLYGLNLSKASTAIYFSNPLSGNERTQSEDRIEHNDKKEPLLYIDLITKDSIDEDIYRALKSKHKQSRYFLGEVIENMRVRRAA